MFEQYKNSICDIKENLAFKHTKFLPKCDTIVHFLMIANFLENHKLKVFDFVQFSDCSNYSHLFRI